MQRNTSSDTRNYAAWTTDAELVITEKWHADTAANTLTVYRAEYSWDDNAESYECDTLQMEFELDGDGTLTHSHEQWETYAEQKADRVHATRRTDHVAEVPIGAVADALLHGDGHSRDARAALDPYSPSPTATSSR